MYLDIADRIHVVMRLITIFAPSKRIRLVLDRSKDSADNETVFSGLYAGT